MKETTSVQSLHGERNLKQGSTPLMIWSLKTVAQPPKIRKIAILTCLIPTAIISLAAIWSLHNGTQEDFERRFYFVPAALIIGLIFIAICRQKTVFNYRIYIEHGEVDSCHFFPNYAGYLFKGVVIFSILMIIGVATYTGSFLVLLFGPIAVLLGTGGTLLSWTPPVPELETSLPWSEYKYVTIDRKYRIIVTHRTDMTLGFEARFSDKKSLKQYLTFLRTVLPPTVQYKEEVWKW